MALSSDDSFTVQDFLSKDVKRNNKQAPPRQSCTSYGSLFSAGRDSAGSSEFINSSSVIDISKSSAISLNKLDFTSIGLYGRDDEIDEIMECYQSVVQSGKPKDMVLLSGYAGSGKSAIVNKFRKQCTEKVTTGKCKKTGKIPFFATGKFDLNRRVEPYTAFVSAFAELCSSIASLDLHEHDEFSVIRDDIGKALGSEAPLLYELIPDLVTLLGNDKKKETPKVSIDRTKNRFNYVIRQFVRAVSSPDRPLILYLDDLQWADSASLELLENLAIDGEIKGMLIIGCYRDNEVDEAHPLSVTLKEIESTLPNKESKRSTRPNSTKSTSSHKSSQSRFGLKICQIPIGNLSQFVVNEIIADLLHMDVSETETLALILHGKTQGNIFFVFQCLTFLFDEDMLSYNFGKMRWNWDDEEVRTKVRVSDNVADMLRLKLKTKLPWEVTEVLTIASCIGASFDTKTLIVIAENNWAEKTSFKTTAKDTASIVKECLDYGAREGLLVSSTSKDSYSFAHDQVQLAAWSLIPQEEQNHFCLKIGQTLIDELNSDELAEHIFVAVDLLNSGSKLVADNEKRIDLAQLNGQAAKKAMQSSAFHSAVLYLGSAIELLESDRWSKHPELTLALYTTAIEAYYCTANFDRLREYADIVLGQDSVSFQDKIGVHTHVIMSIGAEGRLNDVIDLTLQVLARLGAKFPRKWGKVGVILELIKTKRLLKKHPIDSLLNLPQMKDQLKVRGMQIMDSSCAYAFALDTDLWILLNFKMLQWTIKYGVSKYSSTPFAVYGMVMVSLLGDAKGGAQFGRAALALAQRPSGLETKSAVIRRVAMFIEPWSTPYQVSRRHFLDGYRIGLQTGDIENAMLNVLTFCALNYSAGSPLSQVCDDMETYSAQMHSFQQTLLERVLSVVHQTALNLMGYSLVDPIVLTGDAMDQQELLGFATKSKNAHIAALIHSYRLELAYRFCEYDLLPELIGNVQSLLKTNPNGLTLQRNALFEGLAAFAVVRKGKKKRKWRKHADKIVKKVKGWVNNGTPNCTHVLHLFEAEKLELEGNIDEAKKSYDLAASKARRMGFRHDMAMAMERAGEMFIAVGDNFWANHYLESALNSYIEWEALAKARQLYNNYRKHISDDFADRLREKDESITSSRRQRDSTNDD